MTGEWQVIMKNSVSFWWVICKWRNAHLNGANCLSSTPLKNVHFCNSFINNTYLRINPGHMGIYFLGGKKKLWTKGLLCWQPEHFKNLLMLRLAVDTHSHLSKTCSIHRTILIYFFSDPVNLATQIPTSIFILGGKGFSADAHITTTLAAFIHNNIKILL